MWKSTTTAYTCTMLQVTTTTRQIVDKRQCGTTEPFWVYIAELKDKKAVLSQRWPRNAPYRPTWCPKIFMTPWLRPRLVFPTFFHGLLFRSTLWMFLQNLKYEPLPVPEIIGGTPKNWAAPGYAHVSFSPKCLMGFYSHWPCKCTRQIWSPWLYLFLR